MSTDSGIPDDELAEFVVTEQIRSLEVKEKANLLRAIRKQGVAAGVSPQDWSIAKRLTKSGDPEIFASHIKEIVRISRILMPEVIQADDLFAGVPQLSAKTQLSVDMMNAQKAGFIVGNNGDGPEGNPYQEGSQLHAEWYNAWDRGLRNREAGVGPKTKLVKAKRQAPQKKERIPGLEPSRFTRGEEPASAAVN